MRRLFSTKLRRSAGAAGYLYWWRRGPQKSFDLFFPVFVSSRSADHAFTYAVPLNFYWRNADDANLLAVPLFYFDSNKNKASVQADVDAVDKAGARIGTPSFFINGKLVQGAQPFDAFKTAIDSALASK